MSRSSVITARITPKTSAASRAGRALLSPSAGLVPEAVRFEKPTDYRDVVDALHGLTAQLVRPKHEREGRFIARGASAGSGDGAAWIRERNQLADDVA